MYCAHPVSSLSPPLDPLIIANCTKSTSRILILSSSRIRVRRRRFICASHLLYLLLSIHLSSIRIRFFSRTKRCTRCMYFRRNTRCTCILARSMREAHRSSHILSIMHFFDRIGFYSLAPFYRNREYETTGILA